MNPEIGTVNRNFVHLAKAMVHDMRSPLTSIGGFAQLMLRDNSIGGESRQISILL